VNELSVEPVAVTVGVLHASEAVGAVELGTSSKHSISILAGTVVNTGGVKSAVHVTVRDAVDVFPQASRAVHVLV
jgi:hypothetical protein